MTAHAIGAAFVVSLGLLAFYLRRGIARRARLVAIRDARLDRRRRSSVRFTGYDQTKVAARLRRERGQAAQARAKATRVITQIERGRVIEAAEAQRAVRPDNVRPMRLAGR